MNDHLDTNLIRGYVDGELDEARQEAARAHLVGCAECRQRVDAESAQKERVSALLADLTPERSSRSHLSTAAARRRLEDRLTNLKQKQEATSMWKKIFSPKTRAVWTTGLITAVLGISLAIPQVRAFATGLLGVFRVQQVAVVQINPDGISSNLNSIEPGLQNILAEDAVFTTEGEAQTVSTAEEAGALAGYQVRLPADSKDIAGIIIEPAIKGDFTLDTEKINGILADLSMEDLLLPEELNGAKAYADIAPVTMVGLGACQLEALPEGQSGSDIESPTFGGDDCQVFSQLPAPTLSAPEGLDIAKYGKAFLVLAGMSEADAEAFSQRIDWTTTLVIPIPIDATSYETVYVDDVEGTLIESTQNDESGEQNGYLLMWVRDGMVYVISGQGDASAAVSLANAIQ